MQIRQVLEIPEGYPAGNRPGFTVLVLLQAAPRCTVYLSVATIYKKAVAVQPQRETLHIAELAGDQLQAFRYHQKGVGLFFVDEFVEFFAEFDAFFIVKRFADIFDEPVGLLIDKTNVIAAAGIFGLTGVPDLIRIAFVG